MKKMIAMIMLIVMFGALVNNSYGAEDTREIQRRNNEMEALKQYELLLENLSNEKKLARNTSSDYYGGTYINDDGKLVVCVTEDYPVQSNLIQTYTNNDEIIIQKVKYTYDFLLEEQDKISEMFKSIAQRSKSVNIDDVSSDFLQLATSLCGTYVATKDNVLVVEIENLDNNKIENFKEIFSDADFIRFEEGYPISKGQILEEANSIEPRDDDGSSGGGVQLNPGERIDTNDDHYLSVGFPVYFTKTGVRYRGFVTAAHGFSKYSGVYFRSGTSSSLIGMCIESQYAGIDAAIIRLSENVGISQITERGVSLSKQSYVNVATGFTIFKEGAKTGKTSGVVLAESYDCYYTDEDDNTIVIEDTLKTEVIVCKGDSGGVVYNGSGRVVGIVSGSAHEPGTTVQTEFTFVYSIISKASNIFDAFESYDLSFAS